jgi:O-6-methylguanine DNA methyltransferase
MKEYISKIYEITKNIPKGKVATYKQIATLAGNPGACRAVGIAMKNNPNPKVIPCHRVIGSDGYMHGYSLGKGIDTKIEILRKEGVNIDNNRVDLTKYQWSGIYTDK